MEIGVISDTHITDLAAGLEFFDILCTGVFSQVDCILHAGDVVHPDLLHCFTGKQIFGVCGNCDESTPTLPKKRIYEAGSFRIGLTHGWDGPGGVVHNAMNSFEGVSLDALIFGHSHFPVCRHNGNMLLFNPGSATDRREAPFHSVGILTLGEKLRGRIVNLDSVKNMGSILKEVSL